MIALVPLYEAKVNTISANQIRLRVIGRIPRRRSASREANIGFHQRAFGNGPSASDGSISLPAVNFALRRPVAQVATLMIVNPAVAGVKRKPIRGSALNKGALTKANQRHKENGAGGKPNGFHLCVHSAAIILAR